MTTVFPNKRIIYYVIIGLFGFVFLMSLGIWQIHRLQWKEQIIQRIEASLTAQPIPIEHVLSDYQNHLFSPVTIKGTGIKNASFFIMGKTHKRRPGYHLLTVMTLPNGDNLLVNWGWVQDRNSHLSKELPAQFKGRVRIPDQTKWYMPAHKPSEQTWGNIDISAMEKAMALKLLPFYVESIRPNTGKAPYPVRQTINLPNNHMGYAVTWFGLALVWAIIISLFIRREQKK